MNYYEYDTQILKVREWYNEYNTVEDVEIIKVSNPWSVLNYLSENIGSNTIIDPKTYCVGTVNNDIIKNIIANRESDFK